MDRHVAYTYLNNGLRVSTIFLESNHQLLSDGPPLLFETMVFVKGLHDVYTNRYSTEEQARIGHAQVVEMFSGRLIGWHMWARFHWHKIQDLYGSAKWRIINMFERTE